MKILLTGASGFLGSIIFNRLKDDHEVISLGRSAVCEITCDLTREVPVLQQSEMVVHAAGKAHLVPSSPEEQQQFYNLNVSGTKNLLKAIDNLSQQPECFVFISTVAVYGLEKGLLIDETAPLLATDAYGKSKIMAEEIISQWGTKNGVRIVILRLPLISGPNPPGNLGDMIKAIKAGFYFRIGEGKARRSFVNATDVAQIIPSLIDYQGIYNLTAAFHPAISEFENQIASRFGRKIRSLPSSVAKILAKAGDLIKFIPFNTRRLEKLTGTLTFSDLRARDEIGWRTNDTKIICFN